jgi:RHS repeat-associated protein
VRQQFTSKERDVETGLDYFLARYYLATQGRFTSPDEFKGGPDEVFVLGSGDPEKQALVYADVNNPQSLNKYQYVFNNPLRYVDPDGQSPQDGLEIRLRHDERRLAEGKMSKEEFIARRKAEGAGALIGLAIIAGVRSPAVILALSRWAAANPDKANQLAQEAVQLSSGNPTPASVSTGLVNLTEETFSRAVAQSAFFGAEKVAGFRLFGMKGLVGETFNRNVFLLEAEKKGGAALSGLVNSLVEEAKAVGAKELRIVGVAVTNQGLFNPKTAERYGFVYRQINDSTIELIKKLK